MYCFLLLVFLLQLFVMGAVVSTGILFRARMCRAASGSLFAISRDRVSATSSGRDSLLVAKAAFSKFSFVTMYTT